MVPLENVTMTGASQYIYEVEGLTANSEYIMTLTALNDGTPSLSTIEIVNTTMAGNTLIIFKSNQVYIEGHNIFKPLFPSIPVN